MTRSSRRPGHLEHAAQNPYSLGAALRKTQHAPNAAIGFQAPDAYLYVQAGWACRYRLLPDGRRQILLFYLPGDVISAPVKRQWMDQTAIVALTKVAIARFGKAQIDEASGGDIRRHLMDATSIEAVRLIEQIIRLGHAAASDRLMHLLFDFDRRLSVAGLSENHQFLMPLKQSVLADALGLSVVHVNRVIQRLRRENRVQIHKNRIALIGHRH